MNKALFDDLYFGDYQPNDITIESKEYDKLISKIINLQNSLTSNLPLKTCKGINQLCNYYTQLNDLYAKQSYSDGIKFAVNFLYNALCDELSEKK
jgi:hypothetical protein